MSQMHTIGQVILNYRKGSKQVQDVHPIQVKYGERGYYMPTFVSGQFTGSMFAKLLYDMVFQVPWSTMEKRMSCTDLRVELHVDGKRIRYQNRDAVYHTLADASAKHLSIA